MMMMVLMDDDCVDGDDNDYDANDGDGYEGYADVLSMLQHMRLEIQSTYKFINWLFITHESVNQS